MENPYTNNKLSIALFSFPMASKEVVNVLLYNFLEIVDPISNKLYLITSNFPQKKKYQNIEYMDLKLALHQRNKFSKKWLSLFIQIFKIYYIQLKMCWVSLKLFRKFNISLFYVGGSNLFFPILISYILRKKIIYFAIGSASKGYKLSYNEGFFSKGGLIADLLNIFERMNFALSDSIIVESENVIKFLKLEKYERKVSALGARFIKIDEFNIKRKYQDRKDIIGYIGRLEEAKGVKNVLKAFKIISNNNPNINLFIGGDGPLYNDIQYYIKKNGLFGKVFLKGWIPHNEVADYLNRLKIFILPSTSEGLPTVILEAMACGTIVVSTPVGGVPDLIKDNDTGFILEDNSPELISLTILKVLDNPNCDKIIMNARKLIVNNYSYKSAIQRYKKLFIEKGKK